MKPIAIFYHCLFYLGDPPELLWNAFAIVQQQMEMIRMTGLERQASEIICGINGGEESEDVAKMLLPKKSKLVFHGLKSRSENLTIVEIEKWVPSHPNWYVLYLHSKSATHTVDSDYSKFSTKWRHCLMKHTVENWNSCVRDMDSGYESVGAHWMTGLADGSQNIWAGNFWWATSNFLATVPSIFLRERIKVSGIGAVESRYEAEVWIGNGRLPRAKNYANHALGACP